jgi:Flp pilus assembly protein TadG
MGLERLMFCRISRNRLKASVCRFPLNRGDSTAMTFDVAILPLLAGAGVAIDFARIATKHTSLQQATDAAALAIAQSATASTTNADVMAQAYLDELFRTATITLVTISSDHTSVCVNAQDTVQLGIMSMFNIRSKSVEASTCTTIAGGEQLRNRAHPRQFRLDERVGERKFENRRAAHGRHQFRQHHVQCSFHRQGENVDRAVCWPCLGFLRRHVERSASWIDTQGKSSWHWKTFSGATAAGFTNRLNIFKNLKSDWVWAGCFETQPYPQNVNDTPPTSATPDTLYVPYLAPDEVDPKQTCTSWYCSTTPAYQNNYINDTPSSGCSGTAPTDDQSLTSRSCKYKSPSVTNTSTSGPNGMCLSQPLMPLSRTVPLR